jgi:DNA-binding PadR family transcriptional regulator
MARKPLGGPASDPEILILSSIAGGSRHGYAIMEDIESHTGVTLGPGTLYGALTRLVNEGWIEAAGPHGRQRPYRLTGPGARHLNEQLDAMRRLAGLGLRRLRTV